MGASWRAAAGTSARVRICSKKRVGFVEEIERGGEWCDGNGVRGSGVQQGREVVRGFGLGSGLLPWDVSGF